MNYMKSKSTSTINNLMVGRSNNFDIIRLLAAIMVIFSHSFPLSLGLFNGRDPDPLNKLTDGHISTGHLSVMVFFIVSGFLITQSFDRSKNPVQFLKARVLRIFPGLIFVVVLTMLILGPIVTSLPIRVYFTSNLTLKYLLNITLYFIVYPLPGVFEHNFYPYAINGSLWTLVYEFKCYIGVLILGVTRLLRKEIILILFILVSILNILGIGGLDIEMLLFFSAGMVFYEYRNKISPDFNISLILAIATLISFFFYRTYFLPIITLFITYIVMYLTFVSKVKINGSKFGDLSYGTYIFAFPVQQLVIYYFGGSMTWWLNFLISLPITLMFATISWHLIEKNALKYKKVKLFKKPLIQK